MKKFILAIILVNGFSVVYSQADLIKERKILVVVNDSLKNMLNSERETHRGKLNKIVIAAQKEQALSKAKIDSLINVTADLGDQIKRLNGKTIDGLEKRMRQLSDSISALNSMIIAKDNKISAVKKDGEEKAIVEFNKGQQNAFSQIVQSYQGKFDDLIISSTRLSVDRDFRIIGSDGGARKRLQDLKDYFLVQQILEEKFDAKKLQNAQTQLKSITEQSLLLDKLNTSIRDYELCNDALKTTIGKILEIDKKFVANDDYTQKAKLKDIMSELAWYFRNYKFNFVDYPYLTGIVLEIMTRKQGDSNANISDLLSKL